MSNNNVYLQIKGEYQDIITHEDGTVETTKSHNLIVDDVYKLIAILLGRRTGYVGLQFWAVGKGLDSWSKTNAPDPSEEDTQLVHEIGRVPISRMYHVTESHQETSKVTNRLAVEVKFGKNDCNGTWREFGIFGGGANAEANTGIMINHKTHGAIEKTDQMEITRRIVFTFTNGLEVELPDVPDEPTLNPSDYSGLIINQVYGGGVANDNSTSVTHSFIELYNNTENEIDLEGLSVQYATKGTEWLKYDLQGKIPSHHSYLIRGNRHSDDDSGSVHVVVSKYDAEFDVHINNKAVKVALLCTTELLDTEDPSSNNYLIDLVGACSTEIDGCETSPITGLSKQKSARRIDFADTNNNSVDFQIIDYRVEESLPYSPKSLVDGAWTEVVFPEPEIPEESEPERVTHMPVVHITGDLDPLNRGESFVTVDLRLEDGLGHAIFEKKAVVEYQNYSASDKKHNYNIDLLELDGDTKYEPALTYGFSGKTWVSQDGYTLKANTTDVTQAHNIVAVNIIHKSYKKPLVARSCIDGFPCEMYINNVYHGLYTWNLKQHRDVYGLKKPTTTERKNHLMFRGKWSDNDSPSHNIVSPVNFRTLSTINSDTGADNRDWEDRHPKAYRNYPELVEENRGKLNRLISFVKDTPVESFKAQASEYFNLDYLIDYYVWCYFGGFTDSLSNNFNILTTDGQVWYTTFYDLDASFGRNHTGTAILPSNLEFPTGYRCATSLLWEKVGTAFEEEIKQRYAELRATTMNPEHIMRELRRFECMITEEAYARELEKWSTLPGRELGLDQIQTWLEERVTYCDPIFDYQS